VRSAAVTRIAGLHEDDFLHGQMLQRRSAIGEVRVVNRIEGCRQGCDGHLLPDLAVSEDDVFLRRQSFQAHRTASVQLVGRDSDLGTQARIRSRRRSASRRSRSPSSSRLAQEALGARAVAGHDRVGVLRAVLGDGGAIASSRPFTTRIDTIGASHSV